MNFPRFGSAAARQPRRRPSAAYSPASFLRELDALLRSSRITREAGRRTPCCSVDEQESAGGSGARSFNLRMGRVVTFIDENLDGPLSLDRLAEEADLSKFYFSRLFRRELGQTPWAYVRAARVERAKALLERGASPASAAIDAGFCDQSHLTNAMKDVAGKTPKQYQKEARPGNGKDLQE